MNKYMREQILEQRRAAKVHHEAAERERMARLHNLSAAIPPQPRRDTSERHMLCGCTCHNPTRGMVDPHPGVHCSCKAWATPSGLWKSQPCQ